MKKYNEWIVEENQKPKSKNMDIIKTKTIDDLIKTSEELGKPVIYYKSKDNKHNFYVIDEKTRYEHIIELTKNKEKNINKMR